MRTKIMVLCRCQVVVSMLLSLSVILSTAGCGTSSVGSYQSTFQSTNDTGFNMVKWRFGLINSDYQKADKEDWEDDKL